MLALLLNVNPVDGDIDPFFTAKGLFQLFLFIVTALSFFISFLIPIPIVGWFLAQALIFGLLGLFVRAVSGSAPKITPPKYASDEDPHPDSLTAHCTKCQAFYFREDLPEPYCKECGYPIAGE